MDDDDDDDDEPCLFHKNIFIDWKNNFRKNED